MINSEYQGTFLKDNNSIAVVKLNNSVLGGNEALNFTNELNELTSGTAKFVIIDASEVEIMNSTGLGMLANAHSNLTKNGFKMLLVSVPEKIMKLFTMTHLDKVFKIYSDIDSAAKDCKL